MQSEYIYHYIKTRAQRSVLFFTMSASCAFYAAGLFLFERLADKNISSEFKFYWVLGWTLIGLILCSVGVWHLLNPATYEATITSKQIKVSYPFSESLSFSLALDDIERFEYRVPVGPGGQGIARCGILTKSGEFHCISMNYGNSVNKMYKAIISIKSGIPFYKKTDGKGRGRA
jgi:hypothetical protein